MTEAASPSIPKLPQHQKHVIWHPHSGLTVSTVTRTLPSKPLPRTTSTRLKDYLVPRLLKDENIYLAFYPLREIHHGPLFSVLAIGSDDLAASIRCSGDPPTYFLEQSLQRSWSRLEKSLQDVAHWLLRHAPHARQFPPIAYPRYPRKYGYKAEFSDEEAALRAIKSSREAFKMLSAFVTFSISFWLGSRESNCLEGAFRALETRPRDPLPRVWLNYLQESCVGNLNPSFRIGGFLNPYNTQWGPHILQFSRASVPIWLTWGHNYKNVQPADPGMSKCYLPTDDLIDMAKQRRATFDTTVLPCEETYSFEASSSSAIPATGPPIHFPHLAPRLQSVLPSGGVVSQKHDGPWSAPDEDQWTQLAAEYIRTRIAAQPQPRKERVHETWEVFSARRKEEFDVYLKTEDHKDMQSRESRLAHANKYGYSDKSRVYVWEKEDEEDGGSTVYTRRRVQPKNAHAAWDGFTDHQRVYWSHKNEWDLCPQLPKQPPGATPVLTRDEIDDLETEELLYPTPTTDLRELNEPVAGDMLEMVREGLAQNFEPANRQYQFNFPSFVAYLRLRHGFDAELSESWNPKVHVHDIKRRLPKDAGHIVAERFLWHPDKLLPSSTVTSIVDFYNTALSDENLCADLPPAWDISSHMAVKPDLPFNTASLTTRRVLCSAPAGASLYLLTRV